MVTFGGDSSPIYLDKRFKSFNSASELADCYEVFSRR